MVPQSTGEAKLPAKHGDIGVEGMKEGKCPCWGSGAELLQATLSSQNSPAEGVITLFNLPEAGRVVSRGPQL